MLVDGGRSGLLGGEFEDMLRCIRCGACMNHCPVYQKVGGHAYGWVYPGPMGSVLTPAYTALEQAIDLPQAATMCGECHVVCPMKIPLPDLLRKLRERQMDRGLRPLSERLALRVWGWAVRHPEVYRPMVRLGSRVLRWMGDPAQQIKANRFMRGWTRTRDLRVPQGTPFKERWAQRRAARGS